MYGLQEFDVLLIIDPEQKLDPPDVSRMTAPRFSSCQLAPSGQLMSMLQAPESPIASVA